MPESGVFILYFMMLISSTTPPSPAQLLTSLSSMQFGLKTQFTQLHPNSDFLGFKIPAVLLLQAIFPIFFLQRLKKEVSRRKGTRRIGRNREYFFFDLCSEFFLLFYFLKGCSILVHGDKATPPPSLNLTFCGGFFCYVADCVSFIHFLSLQSCCSFYFFRYCKQLAENIVMN